MANETLVLWLSKVVNQLAKLARQVLNYSWRNSRTPKMQSVSKLLF